MTIAVPTPSSIAVAKCTSPNTSKIAIVAACQICLDSVATPLTAICSPQCPAVVCAPCFATFIRQSLDSTIPGILPRLQCPVCLVRLPKSACRPHVPSATRDRFRALCATACAFLPACCHSDAYTQLPDLCRDTELPRFETFMDERIHSALPTLRQKLRQFVQYDLSARALVAFLDTTAAPLALPPLEHQLFVDSIAVRIRDDERRAALVIAFHTRHKRVITRCCFRWHCFICHRQWNDAHDVNPHGPCETTALTDGETVTCRQCRVTLVKVEGCDTVTCYCGFRMSWPNELELVNLVHRRLIPETVDIFDLDGFWYWDDWRCRIQTIVRYEVPTLLAAWRRREVNRGIQQTRRVLRVLLQSYLWRRRFRNALPDFKKDIQRARQQHLIQHLDRLGFLQGPRWSRLRTSIAWRLCLRRIQNHLVTYDEEPFAKGEWDLQLGLF